MSNVVEVSVVVPAYNIDKYLAQCLDSLREQTFTNFECLIVNDGSTDKTKSIAGKYAALDERFRVINKPNGGLSSARNAGYDEIKGAYVIFLDGDDFFSPKLLGTLHASITKYDADIAVGNFKLYYDGMNKFSEPRIDFKPLGGRSGTFSYKTNPDDVFRTPQFMVWNKLFRSDFLRDKQIRHNEQSHRAEDIDFSGRALVEAETISFVDEPLSYYRTGTDSSNVGTSYKYPYDVLWSLEGLKKFLDAKGIYKTMKKGFLVMAVSHLLGALFFTEMYPVHEDLYKKAKKFLSDISAEKLPKQDCLSEKEYNELQTLLKENYVGWLRYRITDLRDNRESQYIAYLLSEFQRKYQEEVARYEAMRAEYDRLLGSLSWKVTKPLRVTNKIKRKPKQ